MKQKSILSFAALALGLASCTSDFDEMFFANGEKDVVKVTLAAESRTAFAEDGKSVVWTSGDKIGIFCGTDNTIAEYSLIGTPSGTTADFSGISTGTKNAALYPYNEEAQFNGTTINTTLAKEIDYSESSLNGAPMAAMIDAEAQNSISFKNPGAMLEISFKNIPAGYKGAKLSAADQKIAGKAQISFSNGTPELTLVNVNDASNSSDITINFTETTEATDMVFYFPLPVATYKELTFSLIKSDNSLQKVFNKGMEAERSKKFYKNFAFDSVNAGITDGTLYELKKACENGGQYILTNNVDITDQSLTIPAGKALTLDLNGKTITADNSATGRLLVNGELTLKDSGNDGKIVASKDYGTGVGCGLVEVIGTSAKMTMESGKIYSVRSDAANKGQFGVSVKKGGTFEMKGGKIEAGWYAIVGNGTDVDNQSTINVTGGELVSTADYAIYLPHNGVTTISGGTVNGAAGGICIKRGTLNISGSAKIQSTDTGNTGTWSDGTGGLGNAALNVNAAYGATTVNISGGTITSDNNAIDIVTGSKYTPTMNVTGGTFSDPSVFKHISANAKNVKVVLSKNVEIKNTILLNAANSEVTLDLNGKTIKNSHEGVGEWSSICDAITVKNGTLTIKGDGLVETCDVTGSPIYSSGPNSTINIEGGKYLSHGLNPKKGWSLVFADAKAKVNISGGYFGIDKNPDEKLNQYVLNCSDNSGSLITLTGGIFCDQDPSKHDHSEEINIPSGYQTVSFNKEFMGLTGTWYKVVGF